MPKPIKKRIPKKNIDTEEEVKEKLLTIKDTLKQRQKTLIKIFIIFLVIIAGLAGYLSYYYTSKHKAEKLELQAYKTYYSSTQIEGTDTNKKYYSALELFKKAYNSSKSPFSLYYIASCYYELGQYDDALKSLLEFKERFKGEDKYIPLVYQKIANIYIKKGDLDKAMTTLDELYKSKNEIYKDFALIEYGKILEKKGNIEEAKKKYNELVTKYPNSPFKDEAKKRLGETKEG